MIDPGRYFAADASVQQAQGGAFVTWEELDPIEMVPGLAFQPCSRSASSAAARRS